MLSTAGPDPQARDQDGAKSTSRLSSVWNSAEKRQDGMSFPKGSPEFPATNSQSKRREAAAWIQTLTGTASLQHEDERSFRAALADGALLCSVANVLCPDSIKTVHMARSDLPSALQYQQRYENIQNFIQFVKEVRVPPDFTFSYEDLTSENDVERPKVVDCVLWLKRLHEGHSPLPFNMPGLAAGGGLTGLTAGGGGNDLSPEMDSSRKAAAMYSARSMSMKMSTSSTTTTSAAMMAGMVSDGGAAPGPAAAAPARGVPGAVAGGGTSTGVAQLLSQLSVMLKAQSMHSIDITSASGTQIQKISMQASEVSMDALGPVFNTVLSSINSDFERKLSAKDQEVTRARESVAAMQGQMVEVQRQLRQVQRQLEVQQQDLEGGRSVASEEVKAEAARLTQQLAETQQRCFELESQVGDAQAGAEERLADLKAEVSALQYKAHQYDLLEGRYRSTREENQRLYNLVQDLKGSIRVFCRIRPRGRTGDPSAGCLQAGEDGELAVHDPAGKQDMRLYKFDRIFGEGSTQAEVYEDTQALIRSVLDGFNVCIFAYGQTGSGKTHTMSGTSVEDEQGRGINYRALYDLFDIIENRRGEMEYSIRVQMLEIYNESLRDLLRDPRQAQPPKLDLLNTQPSGCNVKGAEQVEVGGPSQVLELMARGARNRHVAETDMNERSSRSHQVLTVIVDGVNCMTGATSHACLHLVDLAGSERVKQSNATGDRLVETRNINSSLSALGDVMAALAKKESHVPFRNSKLTSLLADSLSGAAKVMMFMHISPESNFVCESISTLQFGTKVASVSLGQAKRNVDSGRALMTEEVARTKRDAAEKDEQVLALQRRCVDEKRQKEALQKEVDRLKAMLESRRSSFGGAGDPMSCEAPRSRTADPYGTPSHRAPMVKPLLIPQPSSTPPNVGPSPSSLTPISSRRASTYAAPQPSARKTERPPAPPPPPAASSQHGVRSTSGSLTARESSHSFSSRPSISARPTATYQGPGLARNSSISSAAPPAPSSGSMSMRTSGVHVGGAIPSGSATHRTLSANGRLSIGGAAGFTAPSAAPPASAGGRRSSIGQWRS